MGIRQWILTFFIATLLGVSAQAQEGGRQVEIYLGAGSLYSFPATIRVGVGDWEFGQLTSGIIGFDKRFRFGGNYYSSFGLMVTQVAEVSGGFWASMGFDFRLVALLGLRGEIYALQGLNGYSNGGLLLGVNFKF